MRINTAAADVGAGFEGIPALLASLTEVSEQARALPLDELIAAATSAVANADALIASEAVREVPQSVNLALAEVRLMLADLRAGGAVENVNATLASVRSIADELAAAQVAESLRNALTAAQSAASTVDTAAQGLPELIENLKTVSQRARDLPLDQLVNSGRQVLDTADQLLASEGMGEVPPRLAGALAELRLLLADLREGGAVENLNATLASADEAATAVAEAVRTLPALVAQLSQTASRADQALGSVAPGSDINRNTLMLLRELRDAAQSVNSLVTALERRPNSLLFGR
jgi:paraquat-inducible protein B